MFKEKLNAEQKKNRLKDEYNIELDNEALKEVNIMCNLGEGLVEETWEEAWGKAWGKATITNLKKLIKNTGMNLDQAMDALELPAENRSAYAALV